MGLIEELNKLAELEKRATPRPWVWSDLTQEVEPSDPGCCESVAYGTPDERGSRDIIPVVELLDEFSIGGANAAIIAQSRNIFPELLECAKALAELDPLGRENAAQLNARESMIAWGQARAHGREAISALQKKLTGADVPK